MPKEVKSGPSTPHTPESSFFSLLSGWVQQGVESFFATQRILLDLAVRQNSGTMKILREQLTDSRFSPVSILTELAGEGTANFIDAQRVLLDMVQQENEIITGGVKERVGGFKMASAMTDLIRRSVDTFVEMQQEYLTLVSKQAQNWLEPAKGTQRDIQSLVAFSREAMGNFVSAQKKFLDVIAEETANATGGKEDHAKPSKKTELYKLACSASESFYDAQKKLLELASRQMNVNLKSISRTADMITPIRLAPVADLTNESVKTFVSAEKALIDSIVKPRDGAKAKAKPKPEHRAKRPAVARKAAPAQTVAAGA